MTILLIAGAAAGMLIVGVLLGRYYVPDTRPLKRAAKEGAMYIRGLNHVLARNNDAAIAELTRAVSENTGTIDTYFALGILFRERGEHERAVRVHQSILVRADVNRRMRVEARFQLGLDFEAAGFRRRARRAFEEVLEKAPKHIAGAEKLLALHEAEGQWDRAFVALRRVSKIAKKRDEVRESHLLAEMGLASLAAGDLATARKQLRKARKAHPEGVHPRYAHAMYLRKAGKTRAAADLWMECLQVAPDLVAFFFPHMEEAHFELQSLDELANRLDGLIAKLPDNVQLRLSQARFVGKRDPALSLGLLRGVLADAPSLLPARRLMGRLMLAGDDPGALRAEYEELLETLDRIERSYRCARCGHTDREFFWRCPRCHAWDSVRVAWGRRTGEGQPAELALRPGIPGGPEDRRQAPRRSALGAE